jgi:hypothetical protein
VQRQRFAAQGLADEVGNHAAVVGAHAGAVGVEDADDARFEAVLALVGHGQRFGVTFGFVVDGARAERVDVAEIGFDLRMMFGRRVAVDLGGAGQEKARAVFAGDFEQVVRGVGTGSHCFKRDPFEIRRAGGRGQVQDEIERPVDVKRFGDVLIYEREPVMPFEMRNVRFAAGDAVVGAEHVVAFGEEAVAHVRAEKSGAAADQY